MTRRGREHRVNRIATVVIVQSLVPSTKPGRRAYGAEASASPFPSGLWPGVPSNYSRSLFQPHGLACSPYRRVGHAGAQENQLKILHSRCLLRPLAKCQVLDMCGGTSSAMSRCL
jgi:hypothetical protein